MVITKFSCVFLQSNQRAMGQVTLELDGTKEPLLFEAEKDTDGQWEIIGKKFRVPNADLNTRKEKPYNFRFDQDDAVHQKIEAITRSKLLARLRTTQLSKTEHALLLGGVPLLVQPPSVKVDHENENMVCASSTRVIERYNQLTRIQKQTIAVFLQEEETQKIAQRLGIKASGVYGSTHRLLIHFGFKNRKELIRVLSKIPEITGKVVLPEETNNSAEILSVSASPVTSSEPNDTTVSANQRELNEHQLEPPAKTIKSLDEEVFAVQVGDKLLRCAEALRRTLPSEFRLEYHLCVGDGGIVEGVDLRIRNINIRGPQT